MAAKLTLKLLGSALPYQKELKRLTSFEPWSPKPAWAAVRKNITEAVLICIHRKSVMVFL